MANHCKLRNPRAHVVRELHTLHIINSLKIYLPPEGRQIFGYPGKIYKDIRITSVKKSKE
jgi:hypothetical protein